ncbi:wall-associated receptor kinase-like 2 isoform X3 [Malus sylvestris]|uniref:wall-associated receptor kinase-like 2 isoform X3 n=1 Tax=Malus sylvestris TaxID=3752 RepID=UPI0021ACE70B|nr:wall-associated receptor kinase-like 2 isoform X3 [Malus sylvestris]
MEVVQFLIQITLFLWSLSSAIPAVASQPSLAKPNCPAHCGNDTISIPYPFGIGADCFMNAWFEITCDNSTYNSPRRPIPRLNHPSLKQLEVLELSMNGTLSVRNPITFFGDCGTNRTLAEQAPNLTGSPFVFSKRNRLVSVGCGGIALMKLMNGSSVGGCLSICGDKGSLLEQFDEPDNCNGINCCQTTIPGNLTNFNTSFQEVKGLLNASDSTSGSGSCKYAFLTDEAFGMVTGLDYIHLVGVPGVLEWNWSQYTESEIFGTASTTFRDANSGTVCASNNSCSCGNGLEGNPYVVDGCQEIDECKHRIWSFKCLSRANVAIIVISCIVGLLFIHIGAWRSHKVIMKRKDINRKRKFFKQNGGFLLEQQLSSGEANVDNIKLFSAEELEKATDHFSEERILGQGGQGTVYKGMLANGKIVAVKKSKSVVSGDEVRQFINEIVILSQVIQKNVVKLMGCCLETEVPLLVYEFIHNGTLSHYIQHQNEEFPLTWERRLRVATEVAGALSYLHSAVSRPIYHRDIKSSNILLDDKYRAKVADFGTSRSVAIDKTHLTMTQVNGTFGYLDPEYFQTSQFTDKSDVYSYGVVLVELLTGKKPIFKTESQEPMSLSHYFLLSMDENRLFDILDARVVKDARKEEIMVVADLAKRCLNLNGKKRPTMKEVEVELQGIQLPVKDFDVQQNFDVDHVQTRMNEVWDVDSASTHEPSTLFSSPFDEEQLLFIRTE